MALASDLVAVRREIHRRPELAGDERLTAALVERELRAAGLDVSVGVGGHGVVELLEGRRGGPTLAYRWTRRLADLLASGAVGSLAGASIQGQLGMSAKLLVTGSFVVPDWDPTAPITCARVGGRDGPGAAVDAPASWG